MNITKKRGLAMTVAAVTLAATGSLVASPAFAATSLGQVYLVDYDLGTTLTTPDWAIGSISLSLNPTGYNTGFVVPAGTTHAEAFLSTVGTEENVANWLGSTGIGTDIVGDAAPDHLSDNPNVPGNFHDLLPGGGTWSLGVGFLGADNSYKGGYFTTITIAPGSSTLSYPIPAGATAPAVTGQPASTSVVVGANATFTAAASGSPAPTVKWQSAPVATSTFTDIAGATSDTLTVSNAQLAITGTQYRAVYTNSAGSATSDVAVLTVTPAAVEEPVTGDPGVLPHVDLADGESSLVLDNTGIPAGTYGVWAWSTPTHLPNATVDANGDVTINLSGLSTGTHTVALVDIATNDVVAWLTVTLSSTTETVTDLTVDVTTTNKFALEGVAAALDLGSAARGASTSADLPAFTVTDDRDTLPGWDLTSKVDDFVNDGVAVPANAGDTIDKGALTIEPRKVGPVVTGISAKPLFTAGTSNLFAEGLLNSSTPSTGTQFDAELTFNVPATAKKGTYASKLTLTLTSK